MQPTQEQYNATLQSYRNLDIKVNVLDFDYNIIDEISGIITQGTIDIDADSDIRRTANLSLVLRSNYTKTGSVGAGSQSHDYYWTAGNIYWFDKYIQIYVGIRELISHEMSWVNQGIYMLNAPSVSYDATTNALSFQAVDLMCKLTGLRNGYLDGLEHVIPPDQKINEIVQSIIKEAGFNKFVIYSPTTQSTTPYEIKIDIGSTVFDLLKELRDINPNWEMFFDENGVFIFQQIPSGNVINPSTGDYQMNAPAVKPDVWNKLQIGYELSTNFEDVKNYIEVLGHTYEPNITLENTQVSQSGNQMTLNIGTIQTTSPTAIVISFPVDVSDLTQDVTDLTTSQQVRVLKLSYTTAKGNSYTVTLNLSQKDYIKYGNCYYVVRFVSNYIGVDNPPNVDYGAPSYGEWLYCGFIQSYGVAWENNPDSPFYVGTKLNLSNTSTTPNSDYHNAKFKNQIRYVCTGDEYDNIYSNDLARQRAEYEIYLHARLHDTLTITSVPIYWLGVNEIIEYNLPNELDGNGQPIASFWLVKSVSTELSVSGTQTITAIRYYPLYPFFN